MKKLDVLLGILILPIVLSGCVTVGLYVDSINDPTLRPSKNYFLLSSMKGVDNSDLQFREYARMVERVLNEHGYVRVNDLKEAGTAIFLAYGIGDPVQTPYSFSLPVYGQTGGGYSSFNASTFGSSGYSNTTGSVYTTPTYGVVGSQSFSGTQTSYLRYLILDAVNIRAYVETQKIVPVWKTSVISRGKTGDLRTIFPYMVVAAWNYIGTNTGKQVYLELTDYDSRVSAIKTDLNQENALPAKP